MKEKYYVLDQNNEYYEFNSKDELTRWLARSFGLRFLFAWEKIDYEVLSHIGHNFNDTYRVENHEDPDNPTYNNVEFIIFDHLWKVVDKSVIRNWLSEYESFIENRRRRWRRTKYFEFRREPVPGIHKYSNGSHMWRRMRKNKSYAAKLEEYYNLFPNDSRMRERRLLVSVWEDELGKRTQDRSWKRQCKIKNQWQKNNRPNDT